MSAQQAKARLVAGLLRLPSSTQQHQSSNTMPNPPNFGRFVPASATSGPVATKIEHFYSTSTLVQCWNDLSPEGRRSLAACLVRRFLPRKADRRDIIRTTGELLTFMHMQHGAVPMGRRKVSAVNEAAAKKAEAAAVKGVDAGDTKHDCVETTPPQSLCPDSGMGGPITLEAIAKTLAAIQTEHQQTYARFQASRAKTVIEHKNEIARQQQDLERSIAAVQQAQSELLRAEDTIRQQKAELDGRERTSQFTGSVLNLQFTTICRLQEEVDVHEQRKKDLEEQIDDLQAQNFTNGIIIRGFEQNEKGLKQQLKEYQDKNQQIQQSLDVLRGRLVRRY